MNSQDVVVTGVSTGIGWGTTKVLVSKGFRVFGSVRKQADADRLKSEFGKGFVPLLMDITDADAVHQAAQKVGSMIGDRNLVGLVNNAGIVVSGPLLYLRPSEYRRQLEPNMISPLALAANPTAVDDGDGHELTDPSGIKLRLAKAPNQGGSPPSTIGNQRKEKI